MFSNMKVAVRLGLGFGLLLVLMVLLIGVSVSRMEQIQERLDDVVDNRLAKEKLVNTMVDDVRDTAIAIRNIALLSDATEIQHELGLIEEYYKEYYAAEEKLTATDMSEKGKAILAKIREGRVTTRSVVDKAIQLGQAHKQKETIDVLLREVRPAQKKWLEALHDMVDYQDAGIKIDVEAAQAAYVEARMLMFILAGIAIALAIMVTLWVTRSILKQLGGEPDFVADIARKVADGDLTMKVETRAKDTTSLLFAMKGMVEKLSQIIAEVRGAADNLSSASEEVSATAQSMSQSASEQAASVEETSASIEQMTASINQNAENSKTTNGMASKATKEANEGGGAVKETVSAMKKIASKIGIIDDIAYQTNLLALNAAIEAARAGEHGKGFAVVAAEVRKLAERSQVAAQEISELAGSSVPLAEKAGKLLDEIVPSIAKTAELVQEITASSEEQSSGVTQINTAMSQLNQVVQTNASSAEELAATAEEMSGQSQQLQQAVAYFKVGTHGTAPAARLPKETHAAHNAPAKTTAAHHLTNKLAAAPRAVNGEPPNEREFAKY